MLAILGNGMEWAVSGSAEWAVSGSAEVQSSVSAQNWAVCGSFLVYFPWFWYHLSQVWFRHSQGETPAYLRCFSQTHTDSGTI